MIKPNKRTKIVLEALEEFPMDVIADFMFDDLREFVCCEAEYNDVDFIKRYLELAGDDIIIG